ncbi:MAG: TlyA family RNA methyltransferase, partial [Oscillospiraceae bacterium]|nr:TlyA family RNA methyltransferase [Oscillospiraceae bacterium]
MSKVRLDALLVEKGLCQSRERAKTTIMSGVVFVNGQRADKPGAAVAGDAQIEVRGAQPEYVSRGGLKLEKALKYFGVSPEGKICLDCGASTGGFTDCLLKGGAARVYAIDVGYGQLAWTIRNHEKVVAMERTNIRYVTHEQVPEEIDLATIDVSFISLKLVLPVLRTLLAEDGETVCLVKPQFEAGREKVG